MSVLATTCVLSARLSRSRPSHRTSMRRTNKNARWEGPTVPMTVRVIQPVADVIDKVVADENEPELTTRSDCIQDALATWAIGIESA